jgi:hypothetical protein
MKKPKKNVEIFMDENGNLKHEEIQKYHEALNKETDRAAAIMLHAYLENFLNSLLRKRLAEEKFFIKEIEYNLNFERSMKLCYLVGLIAKEDMEDLKLINRVRNHFAHNIMINSFDEPDIAKDCNNLKRVSMLRVIDKKALSPRNKYTISALDYIMIFTMTLFGGMKKRIERAKPWSFAP